MNLKRFLLLVLACTLPLSLFACENTSKITSESNENVATESESTVQPSETEASKEIKTKTYNPLDVYESIKTLGRTSLSPDGLVCVHPVCVGPGATQFTVIPYPATSSAMLRVSASSVALLAP